MPWAHMCLKGIAKKQEEKILLKYVIAFGFVPSPTIPITDNEPEAVLQRLKVKVALTHSVRNVECSVQKAES